jgi:hypothetical protein
MNSAKPFTTSEQYARLLLTAWDKQEATEFQAILQGIPFPGEEPLSSAEQERLDLIQDMASSLPLWRSSTQGEYEANLRAALSLMRHLAGWNEDAGQGKAFRKTTLATEMPACAPSSRCAQTERARRSRLHERARVCRDRI